MCLLAGQLGCLGRKTRKMWSITGGPKYFIKNAKNQSIFVKMVQKDTLANKNQGKVTVFCLPVNHPRASSSNTMEISKSFLKATR